LRSSSHLGAVEAVGLIADDGAGADGQWHCRCPGRAGDLPGAGGWSVAVQDLGLVLVPGAGRPVRVHHQRPAPPV